jgi:hypothetical protein
MQGLSYRKIISIGIWNDQAFKIEFAGALYHITARGNAQGDIYTHDEERQRYLILLANMPASALTGIVMPVV